MLKKSALWIGCLVAVALCLSVSMAKAADKVTVKGVVAVEKNGDAVTKVVIKAEDKATTVALDENGKKLAALEGKTVTVVGVMDGENLVVEEITPAE